MIYAKVSDEDPIRQGDLFRSLPRLAASIAEVQSVVDGGIVTQDWVDLADSSFPTQLLTPVRPVFGIVASQDCDASREDNITLFEVGDVTSILKGKWKEKDKERVDFITKQARLNLKWFYLPQGKEYGVEQRMAADLLSTICIPRVELQRLARKLRVCRLNDEACEHYRTRIADFYRRYAYDEWYPLDPEEFRLYRDRVKDDREREKIHPFPWQEL